MTDATNNLLVIKMSTSPEITHDSVSQHLEKVIEGAPLPFTDESLKSISDVGKIIKAYKLGSLANSKPKKDQAAAGEDGDMKRLETCILGAMALRSAT